MRMGKIISIVVSVVYLIFTYITGGIELLLKILLFLLLPLACIWYGEAMGNYIGPAFGVRPHITKESPGCLVTFMGWVLLALPLVLFIISYFSKV